MRVQHVIVAVAVATGLSAVPATSQTTDEHQQHHSQPASPVTTGVTPAPTVPQPQAPATASADRLTDLLGKVRAATGPAKIEAMEQLLTALVAEPGKPACGMMQDMKEKMEKMKTPDTRPSSEARR